MMDLGSRGNNMYVKRNSEMRFPVTCSLTQKVLLIMHVHIFLCIHHSQKEAECNSQQ